METITVTVTGRGYIVLPASLRKEMEIKPGSKLIVSMEKDRLILKSVPSFTDKLSGLTQQSIAKTSNDVDAYIDTEREDR
jgi:AbrB family looped-hinge helix DNA binding protein